MTKTTDIKKAPAPQFLLLDADLLKALQTSSDPLAKSILDKLWENERLRDLYAVEIEEARGQTNDDLEIDDTPNVSPSDNGVWVAAWIYVPIESEDD